MISQQSTVFPKQLKIDDYEPSSEQNTIRVMQTSNLLMGNGGRTSTTSIILAKCLNLLNEQGILILQGKNILQFGCGVGLLGIYLGCIGANVVLTDLPAMKDMVQRNINLNRQVIKGETEFGVLNWKKQNKAQQNQKQQGNSTSSSDASCLKIMQKIDYTLACECGNIQDLQQQLKWIGREGMILSFLEREYLIEEFLNSRQLEELLLAKEYQYERIQSYHPDYVDERVAIYKIWK